MIDMLMNKQIVIVGGGRFCLALLEALYNDHFKKIRPRILGVADINDQAVGRQFAATKGLPTTRNYKQLLTLPKLDLILELTKDERLVEEIRGAKPPGVGLVDYFEARPLLDALRIKIKKNEILTEIREFMGDGSHIETLLEGYTRFVLDIAQERQTYSQRVRRSLKEKERTMAQIVEGSTSPTFVIDQNHRVTHWNKACEKLTGIPGRQMVGTDDHWKAFRKEKRPTMADLILNGITEEDLWRYYGTHWKRSDLIEDAYEAEELFPHLGEDGKWLLFTAAPFKKPDGRIVGAIETLWDKTPEKKAWEENALKTRELVAQANALVAKERTMAQIIQGSTIPTFVIDHTHTITHWNKALEKLTGCSAGEMVGTQRQWYPFYQSERASMADIILDQRDEDEIRRLYGSRWHPSDLITGAYEAEVFFPDMSEKGLWCWFTAAPIKDENGQVIGAIETLWDRTHEKKAQQEQQRHAQELATLCSIYTTLSAPNNLTERINASMQEIANIYEADGISIFLVESDNRFRLQYSFGLSEEMCLSEHLVDADSLVTSASREGRFLSFDTLPDHPGREVTSLKKEGIQSTAYIPLLDKSRRPLGVMRACSRRRQHFTTEHRHLLELIGNRIGVAIENARLQEEVAQKASFQSKLIGSSHEAIVATDEAWRIVIFNPQAEVLFQHQAVEVINRMDARELYPESVTTAIQAKNSQETFETSPAVWETNVPIHTGEIIPVRYSATPLFAGGRMIGSVAFFQDLREIKRLQKELLHSERLAAVGQTVAGMAHCIKNILHGFKGGSYLVELGLQKSDTEKLAGGWQMVQKNIDRTSGLVMDLLSYSKEREPEYEACQPNEIVADVFDLFQETAEENGVQLIKIPDDTIPLVVMDPRSIHRSLANLVSNAIDACTQDESQNKKHAVRVATTHETGRIRFDIQDNGMGMSDQTQRKLFTSFFSTKGAKGTGLGLLVTRKLIEEHGGTITVDSREGQGTTFTVRLPYRETAVQKE